MRIEDFLIHNAFNTPNRPALTDRRRSLTFQELLDESRSLAAALQQRGVRGGDRVAVISRNRVEFIVTAFASFLGGFVYQPINFRLSAGELDNVLDDSGAQAIIVDEAAFPELARVVRDRAPRVLVALTEDAGYPFADGGMSLPAPGSFVEPEDPTPQAALLYTGGTTGKPKGTMISHAAWVESSRESAVTLRLSRRDVSYMCVPLFHVSFVHFLSTHYVGVHTILSERVRSAEVVDAIQNRGVTHTVLVQAPLVDLLNYVEEHPVELPQLTVLQYGGSPIAPAVIERVCELFGPVLLQNYGSTELSGGITVLPPEDHSEEIVGPKWRTRVRSAGYAMPGVRIGIFSDDGEPLPPGERGEIRVQSPSNMMGYWNNEAATREVLLDDGWLRTGDIGWLDEDGYLYLVDRMKDMIISGGENIFSRDVEDTILTHPKIREAAVVGAPHERLGEQVVAFVVLRENQTLTGEELIGWLAGRLSSYKKPAAVYFESELPRTSVGKVHKPTLRQRLLQ